MKKKELRKKPAKAIIDLYQLETKHRYWQQPDYETCSTTTMHSGKEQCTNTIVARSKQQS